MGHPALLRVCQSGTVLHFHPNVKTVILGLKENHLYLPFNTSVD